MLGRPRPPERFPESLPRTPGAARSIGSWLQRLGIRAIGVGTQHERVGDMGIDERRSTWTDDPQRDSPELEERISEDLSKTPVNAGGPGALGGGASTPGVGIDEGIQSIGGPAGVGPGSERTPGLPESPAAPQPRGSIGSGENAGAAARADTAPAAGTDEPPKTIPEPDTTGTRRAITERRE